MELSRGRSTSSRRLRLGESAEQQCNPGFYFYNVRSTKTKSVRSKPSPVQRSQHRLEHDHRPQDRYFSRPFRLDEILRPLLPSSTYIFKPLLGLHNDRLRRRNVHQQRRKRQRLRLPVPPRKIRHSRPLNNPLLPRPHTLAEFNVPPSSDHDTLSPFVASFFRRDVMQTRRRSVRRPI